MFKKVSIHYICMHIYDCFTFFNELDILEIRLNMLDKYVDKFVLVEARKTHSGKDKPLFYNDNKKRYKKFNDKMHDMCDDCLDDAQTGGVYGLIKNPIDKNPNHTTYDCGCFWFRKERCV